MGFLSKWLAPRPPAAKAGRVDAAAAQAQRQDLQERLMTPERERLIAQAFEVRRAKAKVLEEIANEIGQERMVEALRRMLGDKG